MELFIQFKKNNSEIELHQEVFIPSSLMRKYVRDYAPFREACFLMKGYHNHKTGTCDLIVGYTDAFEELFINILKSHISSNRLYLATKEQDRSLIGNLSPLPHEYSKGENSMRLYHWCQNLPRETKKIVYSGALDFDIVNCFPNIFWKEVLRGESSNDDMRMMIFDSEAFLGRLVDDEIYDKLYPKKKKTKRTANPRKAAKVVRSRLFHPPSSGRPPRRSGVQWYDNLSDYIINKLKENGIYDPHLFFTSIERGIIESAFDIAGRENVILRMHDGFIALPTTTTTIQQLEERTNYKWTVETL